MDRFGLWFGINGFGFLVRNFVRFGEGPERRDPSVGNRRVELADGTCLNHSGDVFWGKPQDDKYFDFARTDFAGVSDPGLDRVGRNFKHLGLFAEKMHGRLSFDFPDETDVDQTATMQHVRLIRGHLDDDGCRSPMTDLGPAIDGRSSATFGQGGCGWGDQGHGKEQTPYAGEQGGAGGAG